MPVPAASRVLISVALMSLCLIANADPARVHAFVETEPVANSGDAADDPAIWVNPADPEASLVIGTDKDAGLAVYNLDGEQLSFTPDGEMNNADVRDGFPLGGEAVTIVAASNRTDNTLAVYVLNPSKGTLRAATSKPLSIAFDVYGFCLYHDPARDEFYAFVNSKTGLVQQWRLFDNGDAKIDAELVADFAVGTQLEGMVADDERSVLYIGEERTAIWRYPLPMNREEDEQLRYAVDVAEPLGNIVPDVEGLALYKVPGGKGYLLASNQGNDEFLVYERDGDNRFLGSFRIVEHGGIDGVNGTDGIDVTSASVGPKAEGGLVVVQDDEDDKGNQNFKYVRWSDIASALDLD